MKHMTIRRTAALLIALLITLSPMAALAQTDFTPGDMFSTLFGESIAAGREITMNMRADVNALMDWDVQALKALLNVCELEASYYDDFGTACVGLKLKMDGQTIVTAHARIEQDNTITLTTSLVPEKQIVMPGEWIADQFNLEQGPAMQRLSEMTELTYITYFYRLGGWVSDTQRWNDDLYMSVNEEHPATQERDEVSQAMQYRVQNIDFLYLLESIAFYFRDNDHELQEAIADALAEKGVTRGQFRTVVDGLFTREELNGPEHWITRTEFLTPEQLEEPVNYDDMYYLATHLAYSVKTCQEEILEGATEFLVSEGTDYQTVGFDGTMPQMWEDFPFKNGAFTFNRKTVEEEGVHYTAQGHMDLIESGYAVDGDLDFFRAQKNQEGFTDTYDIGMDFVRESDSLGFDLSVSDHKYLREDKDVRDINAQLRLYKDSALYTLTSDLQSATWEVDEDFANETSLQLTLEDAIDVSMIVKIASGDYEEPASTDIEINVSSATQEEISALTNELIGGLTNALYTALSVMPQEAMALLQ